MKRTLRTIRQTRGETDGLGRGTTDGDEHYDREDGVGWTRGAGGRGGADVVG